MGKIANFYKALGNNKKDRFYRFLLLFIVLGIITMAIINVGYDKKKGGWFWKPADIHINKKIGGKE